MICEYIKHPHLTSAYEGYVVPNSDKVTGGGGGGAGGGIKAGINYVFPAIKLLVSY